jgi:hypothetical protein
VPQKTFDDADMRAAMTAFVRAADALDAAAELGGQARDLLDLAETKAMAGMALRRRLEELGWTAPAAQRSTT